MEKAIRLVESAKECGAGVEMAEKHLADCRKARDAALSPSLVVKRLAAKLETKRRVVDTANKSVCKAEEAVELSHRQLVSAREFLKEREADLQELGV